MRFARRFLAPALVSMLLMASSRRPAGPAHALVPKLAAALRARYVVPEAGEHAAAVLVADEAKGRYDGITDPARLAAELTTDLRVTTGDWHLAVQCHPAAVTARPAASPEAEEEAEAEVRRIRGLRENYGFNAVEILPGNVGYLDLRSFYRAEEAAETARAAITFLSHADAVVIDLRHNGGGNPTMVSLLASYFLEERVHLFDAVRRNPAETEAFWTSKDVAPRLTKQPLFLLTSRETFSAGEGFAYVLQALRRGTVVGERTGGGAQGGRFERIDAQFEAFIPNIRFIAPSTGRNWEGTGVPPDVEVPADQALDVARTMAAKALEAH